MSKCQCGFQRLLRRIVGIAALVNSLFNEEAAENSGEDPSNLPVYQGDTTLSLPSEPLETLKPGTVLIDKFKIIELLGQGGMGSVYRVEHLLMNQQFALKCLNKFQTEDAGWRRFKNEAKAAHMLDHANLIKVYEFGLLPKGQPFFLMELVEGTTLADEIERLGHLPVERVIKIFIQVAFAIGYAHDSGVVHRDLKPSNIMLMARKSESDAEIVKVVDFGIAKLSGVDAFNQQTLTKTGEIFGSPLYMSPEQCMGIGVDHRSDLYSLGCVIYEALTSAPPFMGESALSTMLKHQSETQASLKEASLGMNFPAGLERVVHKLLEKDPQDRYQSANQLASDLIHVERTLSDAETHEIIPTKAETAPKYARRARSSEDAEFERKERMLLVAGAAAVSFTFGVLVHHFGEQLIWHDGHKRSNQVTKVENNAGSKNKEKGDNKATVATATGNLLGSHKYWSRKENEQLLFDFPKDFSIGKILVANGESYDARGLVKVPAALPLGMVAGEALVQSPEYLDHFRVDELAVLDFDKRKDVSPAVFEKVGKFTKLKGLNLYDTEFVDRDVHILAGLKNLLYLNLGFTGVTCPAALKYAPLKTLQCLDLTYVSDGKSAIKRISDMPQLKQLLLVKCDVNDDDLIELAKTDQLRILDLAWNDITDNGIAHLTKLKKLEYLDLSQNKISPMAWEMIGKIPNLRKVKIARYHNHDEWTQEVRSEFERKLAKCAPQISVIWVYEDNLDFISASTDLTWLNEGMRDHKCPILEITDPKSLEPFLERAMPSSSSSE